MASSSSSSDNNETFNAKFMFFESEVDFDAEIEVVFEKVQDEDVDLTLDDYDFDINQLEEDVGLTSIPELFFVSDDNVLQVTVETQQVEPATALPTATDKNKKNKKYHCQLCKKGYQTKSYFENHIQICGSTVKPKKGSKLKKKQPNIDDPSSYVNQEDYQMLNERKKSLFISSIEDAAKDEMFNFTEPGTSCGVLARSILSKPRNKYVENFANLLHESISPLVICFKSKCDAQEKVCNKMYNFSVEESIHDKWLKFLQVLDISSVPSSRSMLLSYIIDRFYLHSIKYHSMFLLGDSTENVLDSDIRLTSSEENTVRYVAGYIPFSLFHKFTNMKVTESTKAALSIIKSWSNVNGDEKTFLEYTKEWLEEVNRGGLCFVSDDFYIFIRHVEMCARKVLNTKMLKQYGGENIRSLILDELNKSTMLDKTWNSVTNRVENKQLKSKLRNEVFVKWINIRGNAFVKSWVDMVKCKQVEIKKQNKLKKKKTDTNPALISRKGSCGLRKSLPNH